MNSLAILSEKRGGRKYATVQSVYDAVASYYSSAIKGDDLSIFIGGIAAFLNKMLDERPCTEEEYNANGNILARISEVEVTRQRFKICVDFSSILPYIQDIMKASGVTLDPIYLFVTLVVLGREKIEKPEKEDKKKVLWMIIFWSLKRILGELKRHYALLKSERDIVF
jgi:hypothetical protein